MSLHLHPCQKSRAVGHSFEGVPQLGRPPAPGCELSEPHPPGSEVCMAAAAPGWDVTRCDVT